MSIFIRSSLLVVLSAACYGQIMENLSVFDSDGHVLGAHPAGMGVVRYQIWEEHSANDDPIEIGERPACICAH